jgi:hypothetical protein
MSLLTQFYPGPGGDSGGDSSSAAVLSGITQPYIIVEQAASGFPAINGSTDGTIYSSGTPLTATQNGKIFLGGPTAFLNPLGTSNPLRPVSGHFKKITLVGNTAAVDSGCGVSEASTNNGGFNLEIDASLVRTPISIPPSSQPASVGFGGSNITKISLPTGYWGSLGITAANCTEIILSPWSYSVGFGVLIPGSGGSQIQASLSQTGVDDFLVWWLGGVQNSYVSIGQTTTVGASLNISYTNAAPSAVGIAARTALVARGWTVTTN